MNPQTNTTSAYMEIISGRRRGMLAMPIRCVLRILSWIYAGVIRVRNWYYDRWSLPIWLNVPVISVGNITVGGTGKTPMAIWLCKQMLERGRKPAVLSRGYKASEHAGADELLVISRHCPEAVAVANPDRAAAGRLAIEEYGVKAAILDDGFQHRRLGRDLDIVLIDATRPFGFEYLLPRGLLREPIRNLKRAEVIVITRCNQADRETIKEIETRIRQINPEVPLFHAIHRPTVFTDLVGNEVRPPIGRRVGCFAGIARPEALVNTLIDCSISLTDARWWPDHHVYTPADAELLGQWVNQVQLDCLVTTEKDAVKLTSLEVDWPVPVMALRVEIDVPDDGETTLNKLIDKTLREYEEQTEPKNATD
ncbi:MAG: tetraacyldisaccharide 4'-kinase [Planctomycetota bacterium]|nr:MAG: tetraacyldisaccharide 4'-kinase [Planctomycetota bacterium]